MDVWKQIFVDKRKRLVQGVCIDSATGGPLSPPAADGRTRKAITSMKTYRIYLGKQPLAAVAAANYGLALAAARATFPHLAHLPLVLKRS